MKKENKNRSTRNIYLIGFMGVGKTTIGRLLAERLGMKFRDTDELIEARANRSITAIFAEEGEARFRELERRIIEEIAQEDDQVIALGGGAPLQEANWRTIRATGLTVYLQADPEMLFTRLADEVTRPLLAGLTGQDMLAKIRSLLATREAYYRRADLIITCSGPPQDLVEEIVKGLNNARLGS